MQDYKNIFTEVYAEFKQRTDTKGKRAFDVLDREAVQAIIVQDKTYWFEWYMYLNDDDLKALTEVKQSLNNKGLTYLYD